jgi:hypothetical protein
VAEPVHGPILKDNPRGNDLQSQIENLQVALQDWRRTREYSQPTEERLAQITVQCARMVESWQQMEQRRRVAGPGGDAPPLQPDPGERIRALERTIEHEWEALRDGHEESARDFHEQAASLAESCVAAANLTLRGFANAEARLAALEQDLQGRMEQLSRDLQSVVAELRSARPQPGPASAPAFPLESVMRIHEELRESDNGAAAGNDTLKPSAVRALPEWTESATALSARVESLEKALVTPAPTPSSGGWRTRHSVIVLLAALAGMTLFAVWMQRRVDTRLSDAAARVSAAEQERDATTAATREEAARQVADARQSAAQAQVVGNVLAAPDLIRYWLAAENESSRAYAQFLFSRSRGMVFSASRLPAPPEGRTYQLWLLTRSGAVSAGLLAPDAAGRVTLSREAPLPVQGRMLGAMVTLEAEGGGSQPSASKVLVRAE